MLVTSEGRVLRGADLPAPRNGGTLLVRHGRGMLLSWLERSGEKPEALWEGMQGAKETPVTLPARVSLEGRAQILRFGTVAPGVLHLRAPASAITLLRRGKQESGSQAAEVEVHSDGIALDAYLPPGPAEIGLWALGGNTLSGAATLTVTPVTAIGEGLGAEVLLPPGGARIFSFRVSRKGPVGVGVRAEADVVETTLFDDRGKKLGTGVVQMPQLDPGTYLLGLKAPADSPPLRVCPALAGVEPPGLGPPPEVVQELMERRKREEAGEEPEGGESTEKGGRPTRHKRQ